MPEPGERSPRIWRVLATHTVLALAAAALPAQQRGAVRPPAEPGSEISVALVTIGPGRLSWERFGHNAIWVRDPSIGLDAIYNYGLFSFQQESFLLRFIQGRMQYWMQGLPAEPHLRFYIAQDRTVWVQDLNLTPRERLALRDSLRWNERPENRFYRYDYYRDNCSTRVRDALDRVLGHRLRDATQDRPTGTTYRFHTQRLTTPDPLLYTGLLLGLGQPVDRPITAWEEMFLPLKVREQVARLTVTDAQGRETPLVSGERTLYTSTLPPERTTPPNWVPWYLLLGVALAAVLMASARAGRRSRAGRLGYIALSLTLMLAIGLVGVVLAGLWLFTDHAFSYRNENLFLCNPLALGVAVLIPFATTGSSWAQAPARFLTLLLGGLGVVGLLVKLQPLFRQANGPIIALALPVLLALAITAKWQATSSPPRPRDSSP